MGRPRSYGARVSTAVRLPAELHERLRVEAEARDLPMNYLMEKGIEEFLDRLIPVEHWSLTRPDSSGQTMTVDVRPGAVVVNGKEREAVVVDGNPGAEFVCIEPGPLDLCTRRDSVAQAAEVTGPRTPQDLGVDAVRVAWRPDEIDLAHLARGGTIWLSTWGWLPPHMLEVQPPRERDGSCPVRP